MNAIASFRTIVILISLLSLAACDGGGGSEGGSGGGDNSSITTNGVTYLEGSTTLIDPSIIGIVDYVTPITHIQMLADQSEVTYGVVLVIEVPPTTTGSFPVTDAGILFTFVDIPLSITCGVPTGGTVTLTRSDGVAGGYLVGTFGNVTFSDCAETLSGSFSVIIDGIVN